MLIRRIRFTVAIRHRLFHEALHSSRPFRDHCADRPRSAPASAAFRHVDLQESDHKATAESGVLLGSRPSNRVSSTDCAKPGTASLFAANVASVHPELTRLLAKRNDVLLRADFRPGAHSILDRAVARGELTRLFPRTYVRTTRLTEPWVRWAAALRYAGNCAALSFVTGLQFWRLMHRARGRFISPSAVTDSCAAAGDSSSTGAPASGQNLRWRSAETAWSPRCSSAVWWRAGRYCRRPCGGTGSRRSRVPAAPRRPGCAPRRRPCHGCRGGEPCWTSSVCSTSAVPVSWRSGVTCTCSPVRISPTCVVSLLCTSAAVPYIWIWPTRPPWSPSSWTARRTTTTRWLESVTGGGTPCSPRSGG